LQQPPDHHLAQLNIGRLRYEVDDARMADFTNNLALVNGLAEASTGFIWRYIDESGMRPQRALTPIRASPSIYRFGSTWKPSNASFI
jgi:Domain of unknown function (DUF3291)